MKTVTLKLNPDMVEYSRDHMIALRDRFLMESDFAQAVSLSHIIKLLSEIREATNGTA